MLFVHFLNILLTYFLSFRCVSIYTMYTLNILIIYVFICIIFIF